MKLIHLSDLHLGKRVNEFSMLEDQAYILDRILEIVREAAVDAVLIAGDVYDKPVPPAEAVQLFDSFLTRLAGRPVPVFIISGNHDSGERLAFGARLLASRGVYLSTVFDGRVDPVLLKDGHGEVAVYLLPFMKPAHARRAYPEEEINSYNDAVRAAIARMEVDPARRNVLVAHQFVTGAKRCDSEELSIGGLDNVDASVFDSFDYVALGHIHGPQSVGRETVRYCGTPLKYSFSEAGHSKSVTLVALEEKGRVRIEPIPLAPLRDMREIRGSYLELTARSAWEGTSREDYLHVTLTDEEDVPEAIGRLRAVYPNVMRLDYDNQRTRSRQNVEAADGVEQKPPLGLLEEFYQLQNNRPMSPEQAEFARQLLEKIWEVES